MSEKGLHEAYHPSIYQLLVEGDSDAIRWASSDSKAPRNLADWVEEVIDLARHLEVTFRHDKRSPDSSADSLEKEEVSRPSLMISDFDIHYIDLLFVEWC